MTIREFIRSHRAEIDRAIDFRLNYVPATASCYCPKSGTAHNHDNHPRRNDEDRRGWVLNDDGLYQWARSEGCRI
jgi:hypothetical protein